MKNCLNANTQIIEPCYLLGVGIGALQAFARASPDAPIFVSSLQKWIVSFFSLTLFTNFSSTSEFNGVTVLTDYLTFIILVLIAFRIWWMYRQTRDLVNSGRSVLPAMVVIIESGSIYSVCLVILLSLYLSGSFAQYILLDAVSI